MTKSSLFLALGALGALALLYHSDPNTSVLIHIAACLCLLVVYWRHLNLTSLVLLSLAVKTLEYIIFSNFLAYFNAYTLYGIYVLTDIGMLFAVYLRAPMVRGWVYKRTGKIDTDSIFITRGDLLYGTVMMVQALISVLMLIEHLLRNTQDIGLPASPWLHEHARLVYNQYELIVVLLSAAELFAIIVSASDYFQERALKA